MNEVAATVPSGLKSAGPSARWGVLYLDESKSCECTHVACATRAVDTA